VQESDRSLREEQDAEYQRSLRADQEREQKALERREAARQAELKKQQEEQATADAAREEAKRKAETEAALERRRDLKKSALKEEPVSGSEGVALIRVRLPSGASHQRRFLAEDVLQSVIDWVDSLDSHDHLEYSLAMTYPRRVFHGEEEMQRTLDELGLTPQAALLLQPETGGGGLHLGGSSSP